MPLYSPTQHTVEAAIETTTASQVLSYLYLGMFSERLSLLYSLAIIYFIQTGNTLTIFCPYKLTVPVGKVRRTNLIKGFRGSVNFRFEDGIPDFIKVSIQFVLLQGEACWWNPKLK